MKSASEVLGHVLESPLFEKMNDYRAIAYFIRLMPPSIKMGIAFGYRKNNVLFFALKRSGFQQEFYNKNNVLNQMLKKYQEEKGVLVGVDKIQTFVKRSLYQEEIKKNAANKPTQNYGELSAGTFENLATVEKIHEIFEEIREIILRNKERDAQEASD